MIREDDVASEESHCVIPSLFIHWGNAKRIRLQFGFNAVDPALGFAATLSRDDLMRIRATTYKTRFQFPVTRATQIRLTTPLSSRLA
ncbi:unnamed protein product [Euphydryas editha]|uniref:Uncharacterized protein n=1 Tax=Euphydryas editha TaxID=104508 RepID=A0AAU9V500_EUPED|nr:unnamed protein product [Euphydryas editha]